MSPMALPAFRVTRHRALDELDTNHIPVFTDLLQPCPFALAGITKENEGDCMAHGYTNIENNMVAVGEAMRAAQVIRKMQENQNQYNKATLNDEARKRVLQRLAENKSKQQHDERKRRSQIPHEVRAVIFGDQALVDDDDDDDDKENYKILSLPTDDNATKITKVRWKQLLTKDELIRYSAYVKKQAIERERKKVAEFHRHFANKEVKEEPDEIIVENDIPIERVTAKSLEKPQEYIPQKYYGGHKKTMNTAIPRSGLRFMVEKLATMAPVPAICVCGNIPMDAATFFTQQNSFARLHHINCEYYDKPANYARTLQNLCNAMEASLAANSAPEPFKGSVAHATCAERN